jgi:hypothetical protein
MERALMSRVSLLVDLYMTCEDQNFVANVMVTDLTRKWVIMSVTNRTIGVTTRFNVIIKIRKYRGFHEGHHFIPMAMEVHDTLRCDMDHFIR